MKILLRSFPKPVTVKQMKQILLLGLFICCSFVSFGQQDGPKQITPVMLQRIKSDIERLIPAFRQSLQEKELSEEAISFAIDTFRIEQLASKKQILIIQLWE